MSADPKMIESICRGGPWKTIRHLPDDHEARAVTVSNRKGRDRGYASYLGTYEWAENCWQFREGMPRVSPRP